MLLMVSAVRRCTAAYRLAHARAGPARRPAVQLPARADGTIVIRYHAAPVTLLRGRAAARFTTRMADADPAAAQQLMARATGNFKRGNERRA